MAWYDDLQPASFAGQRFGVMSTQVSGGFTSATELQLGRGSRARPLAANARAYSFEAYVVGADVLAQVQTLAARLEAGPGLLVHPHFGAVDCVAEQWSVAFARAEIEWASISLEFKPTELAPAVAPTEAPATAEQLVTALAALAGGFVSEPLAAADMEAAASSLGLELEDSNPAAYHQAATETLLGSRAPRVTGVPAAIRDMGAGLVLAERGQMNRTTSASLAATLLRQAARTDSPTLMAMREEWLAYLFGNGSAFLRSVPGAGRSLAAVSVNESRDLEGLAARNRDAVRTWFARSEITL